VNPVVGECSDYITSYGYEKESRDGGVVDAIVCLDLFTLEMRSR
jgi:hypothetical protein